MNFTLPELQKMLMDAGLPPDQATKFQEMDQRLNSGNPLAPPAKPSKVRITGRNDRPSEPKQLFAYDKRPTAVTNDRVTVSTPKPDTEYWLKKFVTQDNEMLALKNKVRKLAPLTYPVLILGETGTGKELIAKALHGNRAGRFMPVNCGGFPEHLIESELFGHVKGAFTGADRDKEGLFQAAQDGTIFLDEIGELPLLMQVKLLRVLQERTVRSVGGNTEVYVNARVVAATHKNLRELIELNEFREDLYWRLSTFEFYTKPLRARQPDIALIAKEAFGYELKEHDIVTTDSGNVRELEQFVIRKKVFGDS